MEETTTPSTTPPTDSGSGGGGCSDDAMELVSLVNAYRAENGKAAIPASTSMCITADAHVKDSMAMGADNGECNLHSWQDCCYTSNHANPECMWEKPSMYTCYTGNGFENSAWTSSGSLSPTEALDMWKTSKGHNDVILNLDNWADSEFKAMGAGFGGGFAHLWFGMEPDCQ